MSDDESKGAGAAAGTDSQAYTAFVAALKKNGKDVGGFREFPNPSIIQLMNKYQIDIEQQDIVLKDFRKHFPLPTNTAGPLPLFVGAAQPGPVEIKEAEQLVRVAETLSDRALHVMVTHPQESMREFCAQLLAIRALQSGKRVVLDVREAVWLLDPTEGVVATTARKSALSVSWLTAELPLLYLFVRPDKPKHPYALPFFHTQAKTVALSPPDSGWESDFLKVPSSLVSEYKEEKSAMER